MVPVFWYDPLGLAKGEVYDHKVVNKFGRAPSGVQTVRTDIWDRANATPTQSTWLAPTEARQHIIISSSAGDSAGSTGMRTMRVFGLQSWDSKETSEDVSLLGPASTVVTGTAYVIIHRMEGLTFGTGNSANLGTIQALAQGDSSVTAQINPKEGQTQMAIYGIPSTQDAYFTQYYGTINKAQGAATSINFSLVVNPEPDSQTTSFLVKNTRGSQSNGNGTAEWSWNPPFKVSGPAIVKVQGLASAADIEASAGFDLILVDKDN